VNAPTSIVTAGNVVLAALDARRALGPDRGAVEMSWEFGGGGSLWELDGEPVPDADVIRWFVDGRPVAACAPRPRRPMAPAEVALRVLSMWCLTDPQGYPYSLTMIPGGPRGEYPEVMISSGNTVVVNWE
jgi:hypothetical protein